MITSPQSLIASELLNDSVSESTLDYFATRARLHLHNLVLTRLRERQDADKSFTKAELARRVGTSPSVLSRWLANPTNWEIDTVAKLLIAISGQELVYESISPFARTPRNQRGAEGMQPNMSPKTGSDPLPEPLKNAPATEGSTADAELVFS